jgi:cytoskeletal protein CcmA (bactofilin family)
MFGKPKDKPFIEVTKLSSLIAEGVEVTGDVEFTGGLRMDGRVKGNVLGRHAEGQAQALLVLSDKGHIEGSVRCGDALINGTVTGDLVVEHFIELQANARVFGTIRYRRLRMDVGAVVEGQLVRLDAAAGAAGDNVVQLGMEKTAVNGAG